MLLRSDGSSGTGKFRQYINTDQIAILTIRKTGNRTVVTVTFGNGVSQEVTDQDSVARLLKLIDTESED